MRLLAIAAIVAAGVGTARADDASEAERRAVRALLNAQIAALDKGDAGAFAATFSEADSTLVLPNAAPSRGRAKIEAQIAALGATGWKPTSAAMVGEPTIGWTAVSLWITADIALKLKDRAVTVRVTELAVRPDRSWKAVAMMMSQPVEDRDLEGEKRDAVTAPGAKELAARMASPRQLLAELAADAEVSVIGTSAKEKAFGPAAAKLLKTWSGLRLTPIETPIQVTGTGWGYAFGEVSMARPGKLPATLRVLLVGVFDGDHWHVDAVHYAARPKM